MTQSLAELIGQTDPLASTRLRQATVTAVSSGSCSIQLGGDTTTTLTGVSYLAGMTLLAGDVVWVLQTGGLLLVIGKLATTVGAKFDNGVELYHPSSTPFIDFHRAANPAGDSGADYNVRLINDADGRLSLSGRLLAGNQSIMGPSPYGSQYASWDHLGRAYTVAGNYVLLADSLETFVNAVTGGGVHLRVNNNDAFVARSDKSLHGSYAPGTMLEALGQNTLVNLGSGNPNFILQCGTVVVNFVSGNGNFSFASPFISGVNGIVTCEAGGNAGWIVGNQGASVSGTGVYAMHATGGLANGLLRVNYVALGF